MIIPVPQLPMRRRRPGVGNLDATTAASFMQLFAAGLAAWFLWSALKKGR